MLENVILMYEEIPQSYQRLAPRCDYCGCAVLDLYTDEDGEGEFCSPECVAEEYQTFSLLAIEDYDRDR